MGFFRSFLSLLAVLSLSMPAPSFATQVLPVNLEEMMTAAGAVFIGTCKESKVEARRNERFPQGHLVTTYTFRIERWIKGGEALKGKSGELYRFSQWGASKEESEKRGMPAFIYQPRYEVGREYVLFLIPPASESKLTSPVGMQGVFHVVIKPNGTKSIRHPAMNAILSGLPDRPQVTKAVGKMKTESELPLEIFMQLADELKR